MPHTRQQADRVHTAQGTVIWETKGKDSPCDKNNEHWGEGAKTPQTIQGSLIQKAAILFCLSLGGKTFPFPQPFAT